MCGVCVVLYIDVGIVGRGVGIVVMCVVMDIAICYDT